MAAKSGKTDVSCSGFGRMVDATWDGLACATVLDISANRQKAIKERFGKFIVLVDHVRKKKQCGVYPLFLHYQAKSDRS